MDNIDFLEELLKSDQEYWVVAKQQMRNEYGEMKRVADSLWFVAIGYSELGSRPQKISELTIGRAREINNTQIKANICLSEDYPPYQVGQCIKDFYMGFPVSNINIRDFVIKAMTEPPRDYWGYKNLVEEMEMEEA